MVTQGKIMNRALKTTILAGALLSIGIDSYAYPIINKRIKTIVETRHNTFYDSPPPAAPNVEMRIGSLENIPSMRPLDIHYDIDNLIKGE